MRGESEESAMRGGCHGMPGCCGVRPPWLQQRLRWWVLRRQRLLRRLPGWWLQRLRSIVLLVEVAVCSTSRALLWRLLRRSLLCESMLRRRWRLPRRLRSRLWVRRTLRSRLRVRRILRSGVWLLPHLRLRTDVRLWTDLWRGLRL